MTLFSDTELDGLVKLSDFKNAYYDSVDNKKICFT
jgi:hypothetical protein